MEADGLYSLREHFNGLGILLCFNGPISRSLIAELGDALKNYLQAEDAHPSASMDVFGTYIEMSQNIRHYAMARNYGEMEASATVVISRDNEGRYVVSAGNMVEDADGRALLARIEMLATQDKTQLKAAYKEQLRRPRDTAANAGAGLGLLDIARKASLPLSANLTAIDGGRAFFSLRAVI